MIWNGHPLSVYSRVEQTWVDGRRYFDRETDLARREALEAERQQLMALVLDDGASEESEETEEAPDDGLLGYRESELAHDAFCYAHDHSHGFGEVHQ